MMVANNENRRSGRQYRVRRNPRRTYTVWSSSNNNNNTTDSTYSFSPSLFVSSASVSVSASTIPHIDTHSIHRQLVSSETSTHFFHNRGEYYVMHYEEK
mmetsp:Transcript_47374/g.52976  ORF Transcript_47374/g.52976 Transcript_47374/m.52976 type:complete len:99 (+) Transcript_47374:622-918(+)